MADLKLTDIAERIATAIMDKNWISKEHLIQAIHPILKIWLKKTDSSRKTRNPKTDRLYLTIHTKEIQCKFWHGKAKAMMGESKLKECYKEIDNILIAKGLKKSDSNN